jgi:xanthine dehydrogenase small subunit
MGDVPRIALNGVPTPIAEVPSSTTLLDWLRDHVRLRGTKEGCAEGDCGACAVVLERAAADGSIKRAVVNACITLVGQVDGLGVRTVEGLVGPDGTLHPVQAALAESGGTQCGFCTPGFVMAAYAFVRGGEPPETRLLHDALAGNLCRCTGYRPIVDAIRGVIPLESDPVDEHTSSLRQALKEVTRSHSVVFESGADHFYAPSTLDEALALRARFPHALVLAGGTDLGLLVSQRRQRLPAIIHLGRVAELTRIEEFEDALRIGAMVTYTDAYGALTRQYPSIGQYWTRIGSRQIRNMGTIGGNLATASPVGDTLPILLALEARILVRSAARGSRELAAEEFFIGYRQSALAPDELIEAIRLPKPAPGALFFADKVSKRRDQDISAVCAAYWLKMEGEVVVSARLAFGGMAAMPKRAHRAEAALTGRPLDEAAVAGASAELTREFQPLSDWRGSAEYRTMVGRNLLRRLYLRVTRPDVLIECDGL